MNESLLTVRDVLLMFITVGIAAMGWWLRMLFFKAENTDVQVADLRVKVAEVERDVHKEFATKHDLQLVAEMLATKVDHLGDTIENRLSGIERSMARAHPP